MTEYYKCPMKPWQHVLAYIGVSAIAAAVVYVFYHLLAVSLIIGFLLGLYFERVVAESVTRKRVRRLRVQFRSFLESMSISMRSTPSMVNSLDAALNDVKMSYGEESDIYREVQHIITQNRGGGVGLGVLFNDLAERSRLEDVESFASIFEVIDGKNAAEIGNILSQTSSIIGEKIEIEQEIETAASSAKLEAYVMLIMPIVVVLAGGDSFSMLYESASGRLSATIAVVIFAVSYVMSSKFSEIDV